MSRKYIVIIIVVACLAAAFVGGNAWYNSLYNKTDASGVPVTTISVADSVVQPVSAELTIPVFGSNQSRYMSVLNVLRNILDHSFEKEISAAPGDGGWIPVSEGEIPGVNAEGADLGMLGDVPYSFEFDLPDGIYWSVVVLSKDGSGGEVPVLMEGGARSETPAGLKDSVLILKAGDYVFQAEGILNKTSEDQPSGTVSYRAYFSVKNPDPVFEAGRTELYQGDILSLRLENIPEGIVPELESELGPAVFTPGVPAENGGPIQPEGFQAWYAAVPISNSRAVGDYPVTVRAGELVYEITVSVIEFDFAFENLIIDTSVPSVASAVTQEAIEEFRAKVIPLFSIFSEERYWEGQFEWPVDMGPEDFISSEFGHIRITNGNQSSRRSHLGVDIAASTGTPVLATNRGRVLLSEFLLNTGYTIVIDHGGGLKSFYYHMVSVEAVAGNIAEKGEFIGSVGSTGYSTGPHLHFEMRIGEQPISPTMLLEPDAGLYSAK